MQNVSECVKGIPCMAEVPEEEWLYEAVRNVKRFGSLRDLAAVSGVSERSLYRYASDDEEDRPAFTPETRWALLDAFAVAGIQGEYGLPELREGTARLARLAENERATSPASDTKDPGGRAQKGRGARGKGGKKDSGEEPGTGTEG